MSNKQSDDPQAGQGRPLPKKEADVFKNVIKFYESKQYKKAIKNADLILKRYPNHGETLCMKGLIVNGMANSGIGVDAMKGDKNKRGGGSGGGKEEGEGNTVEDKKKEAIELVKKGLMKDMRSHVCWHVYGLLHRSSQNYAEAIKAYKQALRIDIDNLQILRDMSLLQIQMRDLKGFQDTRLQILTLRPNHKGHWLTYALSVHVTGNAEGAVGIIDSYMDTLEKETSEEFQRNYESSELAMYKNMCLAETELGGGDEGKDESGAEDGLGGVRIALKHLDKIHNVVVDETGWLIAKVSYQLQLGQFEDAKSTVSMLFERGSTEDHRVHGAYMCALLKCDRATVLEVEKLRGTATLATFRPLSDDERAVLIKAYGDNTEEEGLMSAYPRSPAIKRIHLMLQPPTSTEFKSAIDTYVQRQIIKGVPSLGADLSSLYLMEEVKPDGQTRYALAKDPVDVKSHAVHRQLVELVDSYIASLSANNTFPNNVTEHPPSALLWSWYLRSILHEQVAEYAEGITLINKCIDHTPTAVDFYELKARLLESGGDIQKAADVVDAGRDLDHQDRYINNLTTKTFLRAGRDEEAAKRIAMFTREEQPPEQNLYDMQCTWYELELADCLRKKGELGKSLRKYMAVIKHYEDFHEDQFDFHMYCVRKVTLRSYCKLLRFEDGIWGLPIYGRAAEEVIKLHLHLIDNPAKSQEEEEPDYSKMTPAERKKAKNIARKKAKKAAASSAGGGGGNDNKSANGSGNKKKVKPHIIDEDPEGKELLVLDHLEEAKKYSSLLVRHAPKRISAWALHYDVSVRRGKMLMALQALFKMRSIDSNSHELFSRIVDFSNQLSKRGDKGHAASEQVITDEFPELMNGKSLSDFVQMAVDNVKADALSTLSMRIAVANAMISTTVGSAADASSLLLDSKLNVRGVTVETCREALTFMESLDTTAGGGGNKERMAALVMMKFSFAKDF